MANYPYCVKIGSLKKFIKMIPTVGTPDKVSQKYLASLNFRSSNDRAIIPIMRFIGFTDDSGSPSPSYTQYRDRSQSKKVMAMAVRKSYSNIFKTYPDAQDKDPITLQNFFSTHTGLGERSVRAVVETFKALCSLADFSEAGAEGGQEESEGSAPADPSPSKEVGDTHTLHLTLSQGRTAKIVVPADINPEEIEKLKKLLGVLT